MPRIPEHPKTSQRSRGPTGKGAKPPADGPAPKEAITGPRDEQPARTRGARVPPEGAGKRK